MKYLTFNDVLIKPKYSTIKSRGDVNIATTTEGHLNHSNMLDLSIPICSSNMDTVTGYEMAIAMVTLGCAAFLPRNISVSDNVQLYCDIIDEIQNSELLSQHEKDIYTDNIVCTIGVSEKEFARFEKLYDVGCRVFCIDVAHGHSEAVMMQAANIRDFCARQPINEHDNIETQVLLIAGNIVTQEAAIDYLKWQIDIAKVGIGAGSACTTRIKTGVGVPQLSAIKEVSKIMPVIADGGIRCPGDAAKAIGAGASLVMLGGLLAGTDEAPGVVSIENGKARKGFRGMSSREVNEELHDGVMPSYKTDEGVSVYVDCKGPVKAVIDDIAGGLRSAFSYVGAENIDDYWNNVEFIEMTHEGYIEGTPHIGL